MIPGIGGASSARPWMRPRVMVDRPVAAGSHPNEPAGTTLIGSADGTVAESGGSAFGMPIFGAWNRDTGDISVVTDATNPTGSGEAVRFTWAVGSNPYAGIAVANFGASYSELYVLHRIYYEAGFPNTKHYYWGLDGGLGTGFYIDAFPAGNDTIRVINQNGGSPNPVIDSDESEANGGNLVSPMVTGEWLSVEMHMVDESSAGANDGECTLWVNGTLAGHRTGLDLGTGGGSGFNTLQWYADANTIPAECYYRIGELYIAGIS